MPNRSKKYVFVPFCLLAQGFQAQGIVKYEHQASIKPILDLLIKENINIIQMPCTEYLDGKALVRKPQGISKYDTKEFNNHCQKKADEVIRMVKTIIQSGYEVVAILGIEQSPSCCVNYIYTNKGMVNTKGLFISKVYEGVKEYHIPFVGINRKYVRKSVKILEEIIKKGD